MNTIKLSLKSFVRRLWCKQSRKHFRSQIGLVLEGVPDNVLSGGEGKGTGGGPPILRFYRSNTAAQMVGMMVVDAFIGTEHHPGVTNTFTYCILDYASVEECLSITEVKC